ncbi:MAG: hypothetical protein MHM6MM_002126 [Cercozoa sp. M6MM]
MNNDIDQHRIPGLVVERPFIYGNVSHHLDVTRQQTHKDKTPFRHKWTAYVRGTEGEDLGYFIEKVVFHLHSTFPNPVRVLTEAPFEVTEKGYGEFRVKIVVYFRCKEEKPVTLHHMLRLNSPDEASQKAKLPVRCDRYDEFVFVSPTLSLYKRLLLGPVKLHRNNEDRKPPVDAANVDDDFGYPASIREHARQEQKELQQILEAHRIVHRSLVFFARRYGWLVDTHDRVLKKAVEKGIVSDKRSK